METAVVVSNYNKNGNVYETVDAIKKAGFKNVFIEWYDKDWEISQEEQLCYAREQGLNVIFVHLGYQTINDLWREEETGIVERYKNDLDACAKNKIPMVVMHLTSKTEAPMYSETGLKRVREICDYAKKLGIKVAFENTKIKGYLDYVMEHIKNENVGICFDAGHSHAHFKDDFNFPSFKDRIFAVHLHDNDGEDDLHLLPFDGTINWEKVVENLVNSNYQGYITLEIHYHRQYTDMSLDEFYEKGYEIGEKLKEMFEKQRKSGEEYVKTK